MRRCLSTSLFICALSACSTEPEPFALAFPVQQRGSVDWLIGVDHDPMVHEAGLGAGECQNYRGRAFPDCYDEHRGSDYALAGGFEAMDAGSAMVVAAADGVVIDIHDGEYDRCHLNLDSGSIDCDGFPMRANSITIEHEDGITTRYLHLMKGSLLVEVGQEITCGDALALIGSSGISSFPHLHFELQQDGIVIDPYAGEFSQERSWWVEQHPTGEIWPSSTCQ